MGNELTSQCSTSDDNIKKVIDMIKEREGPGGKIIDINVGNQRFSTLQKTLDKVTGTKMETILSKAHVEKDGSIFIDRDPTLFEIILDGLRSDSLSMIEDDDMSRQLYKELRYFGIEEHFVKSFGSQMTGSSLVTDFNHLATLNRWCGAIGKQWVSLYKASIDGFGAPIFHKKCDGKSHTLVIIQSASGNIFGGWTDALCWDQSGTYLFNPTCFLFSLTNGTSTTPVQFTNTGSKHGNMYSIFGSANYGPTFGGGHDLYICDNSNKVKHSSSSLGHSFASVNKSFAHGTTAAQSYLAGSYQFLVKEIEVYQLK